MDVVANEYLYPERPEGNAIKPAPKPTDAKAADTIHFRSRHPVKCAQKQKGSL